jgi:hypothetical protein
MSALKCAGSSVTGSLPRGSGEGLCAPACPAPRAAIAARLIAAAMTLFVVRVMELLAVVGMDRADDRPPILS